MTQRRRGIHLKTNRGPTPPKSKAGGNHAPGLFHFKNNKIFLESGLENRQRSMWV